MTDYGTVALRAGGGMKVSEYSLGLISLNYGAITLLQSSSPTPPAPAIPTTGQLWLRGNLVR